MAILLGKLIRIASGQGRDEFLAADFLLTVLLN